MWYCDFFFNKWEYEFYIVKLKIWVELYNYALNM